MLKNLELRKKIYIFALENFEINNIIKQKH